MDKRKINAALISIQQFKIAYRNEKLLSNGNERKK